METPTWIPTRRPQAPHLPGQEAQCLRDQRGEEDVAGGGLGLGWGQSPGGWRPRGPSVGLDTRESKDTAMAPCAARSSGWGLSEDSGPRRAAERAFGPLVAGRAAAGSAKPLWTVAHRPCVGRRGWICCKEGVSGHHSKAMLQGSALAWDPYRTEVI